MTGYKFKISLIVLVSLFSSQAFSQLHDSLAVNNSQNVLFKPQLHYSLGSSFMVIPKVGSLTGITFSPVLTIPLSPKWSVEGGIIAGRYFSSFGRNNELGLNGGFNTLSIFGSASYHVNPKLTLYGAGIKQLSGSSPINMLPKSSYIIGSNYNFGSFSIGLSMEMSKWDNTFSPLPFNNSQEFNSPYNRTSTYMPFGR